MPTNPWTGEITPGHWWVSGWPDGDAEYGVVRVVEDRGRLRVQRHHCDMEHPIEHFDFVAPVEPLKLGA